MEVEFIFRVLFVFLSCQIIFKLQDLGSFLCPAPELGLLSGTYSHTPPSHVSSILAQGPWSSCCPGKLCSCPKLTHDNFY